MKIKDEPKATRAQVLARIEKLGVMLDETSDPQTFYIDAPEGKIFASNQCHCIAVPHHNNGGQSWKPQAYYTILVDLKDGLRDCDIEDCDVCHPETCASANCGTTPWSDVPPLTPVYHPSIRPAEPDRFPLC